MSQDKEIKTHWHYLVEGIRDHWGDLTDDELNQTRGAFRKVADLIESRYHHQTPEEIEELLAEVYERTMGINPNSIDHFAGIERFERSHPPKPTNEWKAREEENRDSPSKGS